MKIRLTRKLRHVLIFTTVALLSAAYADDPPKAQPNGGAWEMPATGNVIRLTAASAISEVLEPTAFHGFCGGACKSNGECTRGCYCDKYSGQRGDCVPGVFPEPTDDDDAVAAGPNTVGGSVGRKGALDVSPTMEASS